MSSIISRTWRLTLGGRQTKPPFQPSREGLEYKTRRRRRAFQPYQPYQGGLGKGGLKSDPPLKSAFRVGRVGKLTAFLRSNPPLPPSSSVNARARWGEWL